MTVSYRQFKGDDWLNQRLLIGGRSLQLLPETEVQAAYVMAFARTGRKATVYRARYDGKDVAVKAFYKDFAIVENMLIAGRLNKYQNVPGLKVCSRTVINPDEASKVGASGLSYAVLMPWVVGVPWADIVEQKKALSPLECLALARGTVHVLSGLEQRGLAHCDVSSSNVLIANLGPHPTVELIDVEDMYYPNCMDIPNVPDGTDGYAHPGTRGQGCRNPNGDRFAGSIMLAEMLLWHDPRIREQADDVTLFSQDELCRNSAKFTYVKTGLQAYSSKVATLFQQAWSSSNLAACPRMSEWKAALDAVRPIRAVLPSTAVGLLAGLPSPYPRSLPSQPRPQTSLVSTSHCAECGKWIRQRSPADHAASCSHHPLRLAATFRLADFMSDQPASMQSDPILTSQVRDFLKPYSKITDSTASDAIAPVPHYDDIGFRPLTDNPLWAAGTGNRPWMPKPAETRLCPECLRTVTVTTAGERGHKLFCSNGWLGSLWK